MCCVGLNAVLSCLKQHIVLRLLSERLGQKFDFYVGTDTLVENVVDRIQNGHIHMQMLVDVLHTLGAEVALCNHFHFQLGALHGVSLAYHGTKDTVAREVGVACYQQVTTIHTVYDASSAVATLSTVARGWLRMKRSIMVTDSSRLG